MDEFNQIIKYLDDHSKGFGFLYTLLGGVIAASLFVAMPLFNYLFAGDKKKHEGTQTTVTVNTLDINAIKELLAGSRSDAVSRHMPEPASGAETQKRTVAEQDVLNAAVTLSTFRSLLKPAKLLTPDVFPSGMRVLKFDPEKLLVIALRTSPAEKGCLAAFSILHWTIFPGLAAGWLVGLLFGSSGSLIGGLIGAAFGIFCWARLIHNGPYIRINLQKKTYALISVASASWYNRFPVAEIQSVYEDNRWIATARIAGNAAATSTSTKTQADAEKVLEPFVTALNWRLGNRISIAEGVFIEPPKATTAGAEAGPS